jgi:hypothetical protein
VRRKKVTAVRAERQWLDLDDGGKMEIAIEVREQGTATRRLLIQPLAELVHIHMHQQKFGCAGEMPGGGFRDLRGGREMNKTVAAIDIRATKNANPLGFAP